MKLRSVLAILFAVVPASMAAECVASGTFIVVEAGFGPGGTTTSPSGSVSLFRDGAYIGGTPTNPCSDFIGIDSELPSVFEWGASCGVARISECHGAYGSQTHIDGGTPHTTTNVYGLGVNVMSTCNVTFTCEG